MTDILERVRELSATCGYHGSKELLDAVAIEIETLRASLKPFAKCVIKGNPVDGWMIDHNEARSSDYLHAAYVIGSLPTGSLDSRTDAEKEELT